MRLRRSDRRTNHPGSLAAEMFARVSGNPGVRRGATLVALAVTGWAGGWLFATQVLFPEPELPTDFVVVPDLRGSDEANAREQVGALGLDVTAVGSFRHPAADSGRIVGQAPLPGQLARPGAGVRLAVSLGPDRRPVPDVARLRVVRAIELLEATGFEVTVDSVENEIPRGRIVTVRPAVGTPVALPGAVALTVSLGPPLVAMPDLRGLDEAAAREMLEELGLEVVGVEEAFRFGLDQGRVVEQSPEAGTELERGSEVTLVVGRRGG